MIDSDFENRNNKLEAKNVIRKSIICLLISLVGAFLFVSTLNKSNLGENVGVSVTQITYIVLYFCFVLYAGFLATRNLLLGIRELIISKDKLNYVSIIISMLTMIGIVILLIRKIISLM